jgi:hypothetical protein
MLKNFLFIYKPIKSVITIFASKVFKNKAILLSDSEMEYLKKTLTIISIFIKTITKLQAEKYLIIYIILFQKYIIQSDRFKHGKFSDFRKVRIFFNKKLRFSI